MKRGLLAAVAVICCCALAGCFEWTEDQKGNLQSVGLPGVPIWKSKSPPAPMSPTDVGFTPEEASKIGGPVLVMPPDGSSRVTRYRYYQASNNRCQNDLKQMLAQRDAAATGDPPYCTESPSMPPEKGNAFVF